MADGKCANALSVPAGKRSFVCAGVFGAAAPAADLYAVLDQPLQLCRWSADALTYAKRDSLDVKI